MEQIFILKVLSVVVEPGVSGYTPTHTHRELAVGDFGGADDAIGYDSWGGSFLGRMGWVVAAVATATTTTVG